MAFDFDETGSPLKTKAATAGFDFSEDGSPLESADAGKAIAYADASKSTAGAGRGAVNPPLATETQPLRRSVNADMKALDVFDRIDSGEHVGGQLANMYRTYGASGKAKLREEAGEQSQTRGPTAKQGKLDDKPYADRREAIDDAVNLLEEGADSEGVYKSFERAGIKRSEIARRGQERGSDYFQSGGVIPSGKQAPQAITVDKLQAVEPGWGEGMVNTAIRGKEAAGRTIDVIANRSGIMQDETLASRIAQRQNKIDAAAPDSVRQAGMQEISDAKDGLFAAAKAIATNPVSAISMLAESAIASSPAIVAGAAGSVMGPVAGPAIGFAAGGAMEYGATIVETMQSAGMDSSDPASVASALANPELMKLAQQRGVARGITIGAFNAATLGLAGSFAKPLLNAIASGATGQAARIAGKSAAVGMVGDSIGEAAAQKVVGDKLNYADILIEGLAGAPGGVADTAGAALHSRSNAIQQGAPRAPDVVNFSDPNSPASQAGITPVVVPVAPSNTAPAPVVAPISHQTGGPATIVLPESIDPIRHTPDAELLSRIPEDTGVENETALPDTQVSGNESGVGAPATGTDVATGVPAVQGSNPDAALRADAQRAIDLERENYLSRVAPENRAAVSANMPVIRLGEVDKAIQPETEKIKAAVSGFYSIDPSRVQFFSDSSPDAPNGFAREGVAWVNTKNITVDATHTAGHEGHHVIEQIAALDDEAQAKQGAGWVQTPAQKYRDKTHEIFGSMSIKGQKHYAGNFLYKAELDAQDAVLRKQGKTEPEILMSRQRRVIEKLSRPETKSEMVADFAGNRFSDPKFLQSLHDADKTGFAKLVSDWSKILKDLVSELRGKVGGNRASAAVDGYIKNLEDQSAKFRDALIELKKGGAKGLEPAIFSITPVANLSYSRRGVIGEVAPHPGDKGYEKDQDGNDVLLDGKRISKDYSLMSDEQKLMRRRESTAQEWNAQESDEKKSANRDVGRRVAQGIMDVMGLRGWDLTFSSGTYEGKTNPNFIIEAPDSATQAQIDEFAKLAGYVLDQKAMVTFDENNTTGDNLSGFVKVVLPQGMPESKVSELRTKIAEVAKSAGDDTLRDGALVFGNFRDKDTGLPYSGIEDDEFRKQIVGAVSNFEYDGGEAKVSEVERYASALIEPDNRDGYLKGTRYESSRLQGSTGGEVLQRDGQGSNLAQLQKLAEDATGRRQNWIDNSTSGRERIERTRKLDAQDRARADSARGGAVEYGKPAPNAVTAVGKHYSTQPRRTLSSAFYGTGLKGAEGDRLSNPKNADIRSRIYFYVDNGKGGKPEAGVGTNEHVVKLNNLYDANSDVLSIWRNARGENIDEVANNRERTIMRAGFDGYIADTGANQNFAVLVGKHDIPMYSRRFVSVDEFDSEPSDYDRMNELGSFNVDSNDAANDLAFPDLSGADKKLDKQAELQAELDREFRQRMVDKAKLKAGPAAVTLEKMQEGGLNPEAAFSVGNMTEHDGSMQFDGAAAYPEAGDMYEVSEYPGGWRVGTEHSFTMGNYWTKDGAIRQFRNIVAAPFIHKAGFDIASHYRKGTALKLAQTWRNLAGKQGTFKLPARSKSLDFAEVAKEIGALSGYNIDVQGKNHKNIAFTDKSSGAGFDASILMLNDKTFKCCTLGLNGSKIGSEFYAVTSEWARNNGYAFKSDETLSAVNGFRRTEQATSYALKTGDSGVILPGVQNRVYGYNENPQTKEDHDMNIARLLIAGMRNAIEVDPDIRRLRYLPDTGKFTDSKGNDAEATVKAFLSHKDARASGMGRSTLARAVLTSQIIAGDFDAGVVEKFAEPVAYSRKAGVDSALSEAYGSDPSTDGAKTEFSPQFKTWFKDSKVVGKNGLPLVVYHGTKAPPTQFEKSRTGMASTFLGDYEVERHGIFAAEDPELADEYANQGEKPTNQTVMPLFMSIKSPLDAVDGYYTDEIWANISSAAKRMGGDNPYATARFIGDLWGRGTLWKLFDADENNDPAWNVAMLKEAGYDGMRIYEQSSGDVGNTAAWVAFDPTQVKSVFNNGDFDGSNPDIRYSRKSNEDVATDPRLTKWAQGVFDKGAKPGDGAVIAKGLPHDAMTMSPGTDAFGKNQPVVIEAHALGHAAKHLKDGITAEMIGKLPSALANPRMISFQAPGQMMVMLPIRAENGSPIVVILKKESIGQGRTQVKVARFSTTYPLENSASYLAAEIKKGNRVWLPSEEVSRLQELLSGANFPSDSKSPRHTSGPSLSGGSTPSREAFTVLSDAALVKKQTGDKDWAKATEQVIIKDDAEKQLRGVAFSRKQPIQRAPGLKNESWFSEKRRQLQDQFIQIRNLQEMLIGRGGVVGEAQDVYRAEERMHGRAQQLLVDFGRNQIEPFIAKAAKMGVGLDEVALYAYAKHAKERNAYIKTINPNIGDAGSGMSDMHADNIIQMVQLAGDDAKFDELHQDLMGITSTTRRVLLDEGLITQEEYDGWENLYENYVPLRGFEDVNHETGTPLRGAGRGFSMTGKESVKALGRTSKAGDILENIIRDYERAVIRSEKNAVAKTFLDLATSNPDPDLWEIQPVKVNRSFSKTSGLVSITNTPDTGDETIAIKVGGQQIRVKINDPLILRAMKLASKDETSQLERILATTLGTYTNLMRNTLTRFNPIFGAINAVRDSQMGLFSAYDVLGKEGAKLYAKYLGPALAASFRQERGKADPANRVMDKWIMEMRFAGGTTGGYHMRETSEITEAMRTMMLQAGASPNGKMEWVKSRSAYKGAQSAMKWLEIIGSTSEDAARAAAYRAARELGKTPAEAASISKNLTTNFNRKGEWGTTLNSLYLFFNAGVQGTTRVLQGLQNPKVQKMMAGVTSASMALALMNAGFGDDDDGENYWDKIPDFEKERNLIFMLPPGVEMDGAEKIGTRGRYFKIPMPYGLNVFAVLGNQMADLARHMKDPARGVKPAKAAINMTSAIFGSINPLGGSIDPTKPTEVGLAMSPTAADVAIQLMTGSNSFGRPVGPEKSPFDDKPDSENFSARQAGTASQRVAHWLNSVTGGNEGRSGMIDVMPGTLDNVVRNATGGLGVFLADVFINLPSKVMSPVETTNRDIPLVRNFYGQIDGVTDIGLFYDRRAEVTKELKSAEAEMKKGIEVDYSPESIMMQYLGEAAESYTEFMSDLRKHEIQVAADEEMPSAEKKKIRHEIEKQRAELARSFNTGYIEQKKELAK